MINHFIFSLSLMIMSSFRFVGTCWGTYMTVRLSSYVEVKAGISMHPSHSPVIGMLNENEENILKEIKSPQVSSSFKSRFHS